MLLTGISGESTYNIQTMPVKDKRSVSDKGWIPSAVSRIEQLEPAVSRFVIGCYISCLVIGWRFNMN